MHEPLTGLVRQTAFEAHRYFGSGFLEKIYVNALSNRLRNKGQKVGRNVELIVTDEDGTIVGEYRPDLVVDDLVVVEVKAIRSLAPEHTAQILNYLKCTRLEVGLLINFGAPSLTFKRFLFSCPI